MIKSFGEFKNIVVNSKMGILTEFLIGGSLVALGIGYITLGAFDASKKRIRTNILEEFKKEIEHVCTENNEVDI